jgi:NADH-quinone oxidoreductase subunit A
MGVISNNIALLLEVIFLVVGILVAVFVFVLSQKLKSDVEKNSAYECGFAPYSQSRCQFEVKFYLVCILFLIFDVEILYFFPFISSIINFPSLINLAGYFVFLFILALGLAIEIDAGLINL